MDIDLLVPGRKPVGPVRINTKHTMGRGIKACWLFQDLEGNENVHDLSGHQEVGTVNGATFGRARGGNRVLSVNDALTVTIPNYVRDTIGTCIFKFKHNDRSGTQRYMGSHDAFEVGIGSGDFRVRNQFWGGGSGYTKATLIMADDIWYTCICGWDSVTNNARIAMQGIQETTSSLADDDPGATPVTFTIGNRTGSADADSFDGEFEFIVFKDYVVNRSEMKAWSLNPYQFLEPAYDSYPLFFTPAAAGSGAISASESIAFTQSAILSGGSALAASESITYGELAVLLATGALSSSESIILSELAALTAVDTQIQDQFRFGIDELTEATHGWIAAQNVDITQAGTIAAILRFQVNNFGDFPSQRMKLQQKITTQSDTEYRDVPVAP